MALVLALAGCGAVEPTQFHLPVDTPALTTFVIGVDHDPEDHGGGGICSDYQDRGFPFCYDGHKGSDFILEGGFDTMDAGSIWVTAAAPGEVIEAHDGEYDRCRAVDGDIDCDGHPVVSNAVHIAHEDGFDSWYYHLMADSLQVSVGDRVECGDRLGKIGSSGISAMPHLHFEVRQPEGGHVDPFAVEPTESMWAFQDGPLGLPGACP